MEKTPIKNAEAFLSEAEKMLAIVKFIEDPNSENKFPDVMDKLRSEYEDLMSRDPRSLPLPKERYEDYLNAKEFIFMIFSSAPNRKDWTFGEILDIAKFYDTPNRNLRSVFWELVNNDVLELNLDRSVKLPVRTVEQYPGPHTSKEMLLVEIDKNPNGMKLKDIEKYIEENHLRFYESLMSTLIEELQEGRVRYDDLSNMFFPSTQT